MSVRFQCPACKSVLKTSERKVGEKVACPKCGQRLLIPPPARVPAQVENRTVLGRPLPDSGTPSPVSASRSAPPPMRHGERGAKARTVPVPCPLCGHRIDIPYGDLGTFIECARCGNKFLADAQPDDEAAVGSRDDGGRVGSGETDVVSERAQTKPIHKWLIAWVVITVLALIGGLSNGEWSILFHAPVGSAIMIGIVAGIYYSKPPCPGCGRRWAGVAWDHARKDREADLRYKVNHQRCRACGQVRGGWA